MCSVASCGWNPGTTLPWQSRHEGGTKEVSTVLGMGARGPVPAILLTSFPTNSAVEGIEPGAAL